MQIKTHNEPSFYTQQLAKIIAQKTVFGECVNQWGYFYPAVGVQTVLTTFENDLALPSKVECMYSLRPSNIYLRETPIYTYTFINVCIRMFTAVLFFITAKPQNNPRVPSVVQRVNTLWQSYTGRLDSRDINELQSHASESQNQC